MAARGVSGWGGGASEADVREGHLGAVGGADAGHLGVAGAAAWVLAIFILIVTVIQFIGSKRCVKYD